MIKLLYKKYNKIIGNRFFVKIVFSFSFIAAISLLIVGMIISNTVVNLLAKKELKYEKQIIKQVDGYIQAKENVFKRIISNIYNTYNTENLDIINYLLTDETSAAYDPITKKNIVLYLTALSNSDEDISDIILYKNMNQSVCSSTKAEHFVSYIYDFKNAGWFKKIKEAKDGTCIIPTYKPGYIIHNDKYVITFAKNIYDSSKFGASSDIGTLMVNFNIADFKNAFKGFDDLKGYVLVLGRNGYVVYDSDDKYTGQTFPYFDQLMSGRETIKLDEECIVKVEDVPSANFIVALVIPKKEVLKEIIIIKNQIYIVLIAVIILSIVLTVFNARVFSLKVRKIIKSMKSVETGVFSNRIDVVGDDEIDRIAKSFNNMCGKLNNYINEVYVSHIKQKSAELTALQTQINPHFLFNTLESLRMKAVINNDNEVGDMIYNLSSLFKWNIKNRNTTITVSEELEYLQCYMELQKIRLGTRLEYILDIQDEILDYEIIKFTLQPIIENAIQHGIERKLEGGSIVLRGYREENYLIFDVTDDGVGIDDQTLEELNRELDSDFGINSNGIGLKNVHDRIRIIYGSEFGIKIDKLSQGTVVKVTIPARKNWGEENV